MAPPKYITCHICSKHIITNNDCFNVGENLWRHKKCGPGSKAWQVKFPKGNTEIRSMLEKRKVPKSTKISRDPIQQAIKEFCGRDKYMRYMDTVNKSKIEWEIYSQELGIKHSSYQPPLDPEVLYAEITGKK